MEKTAAGFVSYARRRMSITSNSLIMYNTSRDYAANSMYNSSRDYMAGSVQQLAGLRGTWPAMYNNSRDYAAGRKSIG